MKKNFITYLLFVLCSLSVFGQNLPSLLIDNVSTQFSDVSLPYWLKAGQTINIGTNAQSVSILEFTVNGSNLEFSQTIALKTAQTVPANKVWKIEAIGLIGQNSAIPLSYSISSSGSGSSSTSLPTIFQSPKKFETPGTYNWKVPPGVTSICVEVWGAGGGGASNYGSILSGGGGGGGYGYQCYTVVPGTNYIVTIGSGGSGGVNGFCGGNGGASSFENLISASGGSGGVSITAYCGTTNSAGGIGGYSVNTFNATGSNGSNGSAGGSGGNGGNGGNGGVVVSGNGTAGNAPGGGGSSGIGSSSNSATGGNGARGQVYIYW